MARGEVLAAFSLSEADAGSDASAVRAQATRDGDAWVLNGEKAWVTNGDVAASVVAGPPGHPALVKGALQIPRLVVGETTEPADPQVLRSDDR